MSTTWTQVYGGIKFDFLAPDAAAVDIETIAHSLSQCPRYGGHLIWPYSVAQHCLMVKRIVCDYLHRPDLALEALLHDAAEAYTGDKTRPLRKALIARGCTGLETLIREVEQVVAFKFGLPYPMTDIVAGADNIALLVEARDLFDQPPIDNWTAAYGNIIPNGLTVEACLKPTFVKAAFLDEYKQLTRGH